MAASKVPVRYGRPSSRASRTPINGAVIAHNEATSSERRTSSPIDEYTQLNHHSHEFARAVKSEIRRKTRKVAVLLISWHKDDDESLDTTQELHDLTTVFETKFKFLVQTSLLRADGKPPRHQLAAILAEFLGVYDRPDTQIIIYYGGHGMLTEDEKTLQLLGGNPDKDNPYPMEIDWNDVETSLYKLNADLLLILDCCNAGFVARESREWPSSRAHFEFIGSTSFYEYARGPKSPASFTRAMIEALNAFGDEKTFFTAHSLHHKITTSQRFRAAKQEPVISTCGKRNSRREMRFAAMDERLSIEDPDAVNYYLHLKYVFATKPSDEDIRAVIDRLSDLVQNDRLPIKNFLWAGLSKNDTRMSMADVARLLFPRLGLYSQELRPSESLEWSASTEKPSGRHQTTPTTVSVDEDSAVARSLRRAESELVTHELRQSDSLPVCCEAASRMLCDLFYKRLTEGLGSVFLTLCVAFSVVSALRCLGSWLERHI